MQIDSLLSRLEGVQEKGFKQFVARCPAHDDKKPSLAIRKKDDGRLLLYCHAGCDSESILDAIGLDFRDLFPEPLGHHFKPEEPRFDARLALECAFHEAVVAALIAEDVAQGITLTDEMSERLLTAAGRLSGAMSSSQSAHRRKLSHDRGAAL